VTKADHYDADLLKFISGDWQKASKVIFQFLNKSNGATGDAYLLWRLKTMVGEEKIEAQGLLKNMKDFEVRLKTKAAEQTAQSPEA
jgi:hypothetical protein